MTRKNKSILLPCATVQVLSWPEIRSTLDEHGMLDSLPFMPEMLKYCGLRFKVSKRIERTCEEINKEMRRIRNTVYLDALRCDGSDHGGCQKGCFFFWKEAWLNEVDDADVGLSSASAVSTMEYPYAYRLTDDRYVCQSTELVRATSPLSPFDLGVFYRDVRAKTLSVRKLTRILSYALFLRVRRVITGRSYRFLKGEQMRTPKESLGLQAGELVKVKAREEISLTLDSDGKNRCLTFTVEMLPFCGGTFHVLRRLEKMIHESTRRLVTVEDTVILDGVNCDGCHILRGGCPRDNFHYWREIWLQRATTSDSSKGLGR